LKLLTCPEESEDFEMSEKSTRDHLIEVGRELMHRRGYNATGLNDILSVADVPRGSFYHHFLSKEDFASAALERYIADEAKHSASVLNNSRVSPLKRLKRYFIGMKQTYGQHGPIPGCMMGRFSLEIASVNPQLRKQLGFAFARWQHKIAAVIEEAVAQRELPSGTNAESMAGFLLNSWEGALLRSQAEKSDVPLETFLHYTFDVVLIKNAKSVHRRRARAIR
jgi:TetR/AcrR family transcriptional repressor of nem operon